MTSELQPAADAEVRSSTNGLQVIPEALAMTPEVQGVGSDDGRSNVKDRTTTADLQVTPGVRLATAEFVTTPGDSVADLGFARCLRRGGPHHALAVCFGGLELEVARCWRRRGPQQRDGLASYSGGLVDDLGVATCC